MKKLTLLIGAALLGMAISACTFGFPFEEDSSTSEVTSASSQTSSTSEVSSKSSTSSSQSTSESESSSSSTGGSGVVVSTELGWI